ncbi:MAG: hypothetical protein ACFFFK_08910 [Candidatus Thorarchaeota archaeon]
MTNFEVESKAKFAAAWITYLATATGILKSLGVETDLVDVGGYTGYAFHTNTAKGETCPSAPTVAPFNKFAEGLESFGWKIEQRWVEPSYEPSNDESQIERARNYFVEIQDTIKSTGRPVGIWGIPDVPEFGIVNGFSDDSYLVSTFRSLPQVPEEEVPILYKNLLAPGGLFRMIFRESIGHKDERVRDREAIERGLGIAQGGEKVEGYVSGPEAFDDWACTLEAGIVPESEEESRELKGHTQLRYHGNSYVAVCTQEGLNLASEFLMRLAKRYDRESFSKSLSKASEEYSKAANAMKAYTELFPFNLEKDWDPDEFPDAKRYKGAKALRKTRQHVEAAIKQMENVLKKWK